MASQWQSIRAAFARHRRGKISLAIFCALFTASLLANFLANDRPLLLVYHGHVYLPVVQKLPGREFGPEFLTSEADYGNPAIAAAINLHGWMLWPPIPYRADTIVWDAGTAPAPPDKQHWLGTDSASRDVLARLLYGLRISILFGFGVTAAAALVGIIAGAVQGFYGGLADLLLQRFIEIWAGVPQLFLLIIVSSIIRPGLLTLAVFFLLFSWMSLTGVVRAEFLRARNLDYVRAAKALGVSDWRIMRRHMLPDAGLAILTFLPFILSESVILLASLDFLGLGLPFGSPSLGELLAQAKDNPQAPWLGAAAFFVLGGVLLLLVFIGEGMRDAVDPRRTR